MNKISLKNKFANKRTAITSVVTAMTAMASQAMCTAGISGPLNIVLEMIWTLTVFTGIVMVAIGVVQVIRCVIALTGGDQLQPGQLGKAIGLIGAGLAAALIETVLKALEIKTRL